MTLRTLRLPTPGPVEASSDPTPAFRDRIAARCAAYDVTYSKAADLESRVLVVLHEELRGVATHLRGLHSAARFREALTGERHFPLSDLCRLAMEPTREAKAAVKAAVSVLAEALGYSLDAIEPTAIDAHEVAAGVAESGGVAAAGLTRALDDGHIDAHEAAHLEPMVEKLELSAARARALLTQAKARAVVERG